jgi:hypothetical protein
MIWVIFGQFDSLLCPKGSELSCAEPLSQHGVFEKSKSWTHFSVKTSLRLAPIGAGLCWFVPNFAAAVEGWVACLELYTTLGGAWAGVPEKMRLLQ